MAKPNPKLIQDGWTSFATAVLHKDTPKMQRVEMRRAFFSGAVFLFNKLTTFSVEGGVLDDCAGETEEDMQQMALVDAELRAFGESVAQGES